MPFELGISDDVERRILSSCILKDFFFWDGKYGDNIKRISNFLLKIRDELVSGNCRKDR